MLGADGRYHLMAEVMANGCGIESWANNSFISHATSDTLAGPYALSEPSMLEALQNTLLAFAPICILYIYTYS